MRETRPFVSRAERPARQFGLKDGVPTPAERSDRPITLTFGPGGEVANDGAEFDATVEWLAHVEAGRIGSQ